MPGRSFTRPPRIITIECSCKLWPTPGMYDVTSSPFVSRTRATLRRGVRLLRCGRVDADAHAPLLRARLHRGRLRLLTHRFPAVANELVNRRHGSPSPHTATKLSRYNRTTPPSQS